MPFDSIMGVGRTPKVTEDVITTNKYSLNAVNIASVMNISKSAATGAVITGVETNIINENYDSSTNPAVSYVYTDADVPFTDYIVFDLGKVMFINSINTKAYNQRTGAGSTTGGLNIEISTDGVNWELLSQTAWLTTPLTPQKDFFYKRMRFIRYYFFVSASSAGITYTLNIFNLKIISDSLQY